MSKCLTCNKPVKTYEYVNIVRVIDPKAKKRKDLYGAERAVICLACDTAPGMARLPADWEYVELRWNPGEPVMFPADQAALMGRPALNLRGFIHKIVSRVEAESTIKQWATAFTARGGPKPCRPDLPAGYAGKFRTHAEAMAFKESGEDIAKRPMLSVGG